MNNRMDVAFETLRESIARWTNNGDQSSTAIPQLSFFRHDEPTEPMSAVYEPSVCMIVQGANAGRKHGCGECRLSGWL
jgi:hypothetical protein